MIGYIYKYSNKDISKGNNLIIAEYYIPKKNIPFLMAPIILISTLITHLLGGSAGREGTAVQMSAAINDQLTRLFKINATERKTLILTAISSGFSAVFGTPITGAIFALEIVHHGKLNTKSIVPVFISSYIANYVVEKLNVSHTHYHINHIPDFNFTNFNWVVFSGVLFGLTAFLFVFMINKFEVSTSNLIKKLPLKTFIGGCIIAIIVIVSNNTNYIGLGIPMITKAFLIPSNYYDFIFKLLLTTFTLAVGFKGGEVTPLFFIGATLGSAISNFVPLPIDLLAGIGFVSVFAGATNAPIACTIMAYELFGAECIPFAIVSCCISYFFSGKIGIYKSQILKGPKVFIYKKLNSSISKLF